MTHDAEREAVGALRDTEARQAMKAAIQAALRVAQDRQETENLTCGQNAQAADGVGESGAERSALRSAEGE